MIEMVRWDMFACMYLTGIVILSLIFYFVYDRLAEKSWMQLIFGAAFLSYVAIGSVNNMLLHIIAGIFLAYLICFPMRFLCMIFIDAVCKKGTVEVQADDEQFERLTPDEQLISLQKHIKKCEREILKKQTLRSLAYLLIFIGLLVFAAGAAAVFIAAAAYTYVILGSILLFVFCFQIQPRKNILVRFIINYAFNPDTNENIRLLEKEKSDHQSRYQAIEMGNNMEIKEQVMQRLRF